MSPSRRVALALCCSALALAGCGGDDETHQDKPACTPGVADGCAAGTICEEVQGGAPACFAPLSMSGRVFDAQTMQPIAGAHLVARDANDAAISPVAISDAMGAYSLQVPAKRDSSGKVLKTDVTLRADASGYETFPKAPRVALPIDLSTATGSPPALKSAATDVALLALPSTTGLGTISGHVVATKPGGTLVVAGGSTGVADIDGAYTVFNVKAASSVGVAGYAQDLQLEPVTASVTAGVETTGVDLHSSGAATAVVSGKVDIVNGNGNSITSVILVVEDTFVESAARGEAPRGLRQANVMGAFSISGVPDGKYVVLAAFENDGLVRDPDTGIGGTDIVHITVAGASQDLADGFKVTGAIDVIAPGASKMDEVSGTPTFKWADDSSEDHYEVRVFDAFGANVWENLAVPGVSGSKEVDATYAGPALEAGMIYQFRATSIGKDGVPIAQTEDLKGVFIYK